MREECRKVVKVKRVLLRVKKETNKQTNKKKIILCQNKHHIVEHNIFSLFKDFFKLIALIFSF
jgi:hypothetical protein